MQKTDLDKNQVSFFKFVNAIKTDRTRESYVIGLDKFAIFSGLGYDEIVKSPNLHELLERWVISLNQAKVKYSTAHVYLSAVELFLEMNMILWHKKIIRKLLPSSDYIQSGYAPFTNDDIIRMLNVTKSLRNRAFLLFLSSTGIRPGGIADPVLRIKHITEMPLGCKAIRVYDESKSGYWAFLTPEASKALDDYHKSRRLNDEKLDEESPVFGAVKSSHKADHMTTDDAKDLLQRVIRRAGIERKIVYRAANGTNRYDKSETYGFRKRFNTILKINNDVNSNIAEKLMAHKKGLDGVYLQPTIDECFNEFKKAIKDLTIDDTMRKDFDLKQKQRRVDELEKTLKEKDEYKAKVDIMWNAARLGFTPKIDS